MNKVESTLAREFSGAVHATLITETVPKTIPGCPFQALTKHSIVNGTLNFDYSNAYVKTTGEKPPGDKPWFRQEIIEEKGRLKRSPLVSKDGKKYVRIMVKRSKVVYFDNGIMLNTASSTLMATNPTITATRTMRIGSSMAVMILTFRFSSFSYRRAM